MANQHWLFKQSNHGVYCIVPQKTPDHKWSQPDCKWSPNLIANDLSNDLSQQMIHALLTTNDPERKMWFGLSYWIFVSNWLSQQNSIKLNTFSFYTNNCKKECTCTDKPHFMDTYLIHYEHLIIMDSLLCCWEKKALTL